MKVYVVLFHDVWDTGEDPGEENEYGLPEDTSVDGIYASRADAEVAVSQHPFADTSLAFHTIEEHVLTPALVAP